jgi:hypothetical protein
MESELDVFDVAKKLVKYVEHSSKRNIHFFSQVAQTANNQFLIWSLNKNGNTVRLCLACTIII